MQFKGKLHHYQEEILKIFEKEKNIGEKKIHVVAPAGSGKTIVGLEILSRIEGNHLILVPNITLVYQWKDKLREFFLDNDLELENLVSTSTKEVKKINIITYQSLTSSSYNNDLIIDKIYELWYLDFIDLFNKKDEFIYYTENLKENDPDEYFKKISFYKKKLKKTRKDIVEKLLSNNSLLYIEKLKKAGIGAIVVDEAHHLTSWWSKVVYYLWEEIGKNEIINKKVDNLGKNIISDLLEINNDKKYLILSNFPYIIGLTATPPYYDIDFFTLDDEYSKLLGDVDYYIPTPAVVKASKLAPWSDLVYFVEPGNDLKKIIRNTDKKFKNYIKENKKNISIFIYNYIKANYKNLLNKSYNRLINYLKFLKNYSNFDISNYYFHEEISFDINMEDISKTIGFYLLAIEANKINKSKYFILESKKLFYDLGYIWRSGNFYKFRTKIDNILIYSKSKINGIKIILDKEIKNLGNNLKCAIITDFLEDREGIINCKYILKNLKNYSELNPILVSGQGIWKLSKTGKLLEIESNVFEITNKLKNGEINLIIGTRGILGEGWDCPELNTLIDLTGIVAYMSVNQVRGRAVRLDKNNKNKVANIYDIVTYFDGYTKDIDLYRLERKHEKFYGVDDTGLVIRGINHIYPNFKKHINDYKNINNNMLKRSELRDYYYKLWDIGGNFRNKEIFGLDIEINNFGQYFPFIKFSIGDSLDFFKYLKQDFKLRELDKNIFYLKTMKKFLKIFLDNIVKGMKNNGELDINFDYKLIDGNNNNFKLLSYFKDDLVIKKFMFDISEIFKTVSNQKYVLDIPFANFSGENMTFKNLSFGLPDSLSKNLKYRKEFRKELLNSFTSNNLLINLGSLLNYIFGTLFSIFYLFIILLFGSFLYSNFPFLLDYSLIFSVIFIYILYYFLNKISFYKKRNKIIKDYNEIFKNIKKNKNKYFKFIYLNSKNIDKKEYLGKKSIIEVKIEKLWM